MKLIILDPALRRHVGHHIVWDKAITDLVQAESVKVLIIAHHQYHKDTVSGAKVIPHFRDTPYHTLNTDPLLVAYDDFRFYNNRIVQDLKKLPEDTFGPDDLIMVPTAHHNQLTGIMSWYFGLNRNRRPELAVGLMLQSGCSFNPALNDFEVSNFDIARFNKFAFRAGEKNSRKPHYFGCGRAHTAEYSWLLGYEIENQPVFNSGVQARVHNPPKIRAFSKKAILYAGIPKEDKGFLYLPEMVETLCERYPDWHFTVQISSIFQKGEGGRICDLLNKYQETYQNYTLMNGFIDNEAYADMMATNDLIVTSYDVKQYGSSSSGLVWEGLANGHQLVVPADSWCETEVTRWGGLAEFFNEFTAESIIAATERAIKAAPETNEDMIDAANTFLEANKPERMLEQLRAIWPALAERS